jgi:hypothetical protein
MYRSCVKQTSKTPQNNTTQNLLPLLGRRLFISHRGFSVGNERSKYRRSFPAKKNSRVPFYATFAARQNPFAGGTPLRLAHSIKTSALRLSSQRVQSAVSNAFA